MQAKWIKFDLPDAYLCDVKPESLLPGLAYCWHEELCSSSACEDNSYTIINLIDTILCQDGIYMFVFNNRAPSL